MEKDVVEKLSELGFELDSYSNGKHECVCPMCSHKRKPIHQKQKCAAVWIEDDFATYNCVHCGEHGFITTDKPSVHKQKYTKPLVVVKNNADEAEEFFKSRGISVETLKKFGVYVEREKFSEPMIAFPYFKGGRVVNVKYRGIKQKKFCQEVNCEPVVYNYDNVFGSKSVIIVEGECFTGNTEILTSEGWVRFDNYNNEKVVQVNEDMTAELVEPLAVVKKHFEGNLLKRQNRNVDVLATPGHNIVYVSNNKVQKRKFKDMPSAIVGYVPTAVRLKNKRKLDLSDSEIRLLIAISADGSIDKKSSTGHIRVAFKKERKIERFESLLNDCSVKYVKTIQPNGYTYFGLCWKKAVKVFPNDWLFSMSEHQRNVFLNELVFWDGNTVPNRTMTEYSTKLYDNAVFVQTLCHLSGFNSTVISRSNEYGKWFKVTMLWNKNSVSWKSGTKNEEIPYVGEVYCVSVPSGMILTRNNGKITVIGNCDALTFAEAGFDNIVSIPSGSVGSEVSNDYDGAKFDFLKVSQPLFDVAEKIYLALDSDLPGQYMTKALIDRIGREKIMLVDWTKYRVQGKDANDFWLKDKTIIADAIATAKEIPLRGIIQAGSNIEMFEQYLVDGTKNAISAGYSNLDKLIKFELGNFVTITGVPSSGKSYFATAMILNLAKNYNMKTLYCAFENSQNQLLKKWCQILAGRPVVDASEEVLESIRPHYQFIRDHFYIMEDMTSNLTVDSLLDVASQAVKQHGIKCIIIDPLNKLNYSKSNNMTEDIGQLLNKLISFAKRHNVLMFLVAHPTKPADGSRKLGSQNVPSGYDIAGSANFLNMSDVIMTVHRKQDENGNKSSVARVMVSKVRDTDYGHEGSCYFDYNPYSGRYFEVDKAYYDNAKNNESEAF